MHRPLGCARHRCGEHRGWHGVQLGHVAAGSPAVPSYHCGLKTLPLSWHLSFPSPPETRSGKRLGGSWGVGAGREAPYSWCRRGSSTAALQWEDSAATTGVPSTAALGSEGLKRGLFSNFPAQIKEDRAGRELCPCFYMLFICFYSSYCCSPSVSFTAFQMGKSITRPQCGAWV